MRESPQIKKTPYGVSFIWAQDSECVRKIVLNVLFFVEYYSIIESIRKHLEKDENSLSKAQCVRVHCIKKDPFRSLLYLGRSGLSWVARIKRAYGFCFKEFHSFCKSPSLSARSSLEPLKCFSHLQQRLKKTGTRPVFFNLGRSGLEPPTSPLSGVRSNHLS